MSTYWELHGLHGVMAEFTDPEALLEAAHRTYDAGYRKMDAYSPMPIEGLAEAIGFRRHYVSLAVLIGGLCGCAGGFSLMYWITVIAYPLNAGGKPFNSWPAYVPPTFECTILLAALTSMVAMFAMNGLPSPYHPVFNVPAFERASQDRFFLCIEADDPKFDREETKFFLRQLSPVEVTEVEK